MVSSDMSDSSEADMNMSVPVGELERLELQNVEHLKSKDAKVSEESNSDAVAQSLKDISKGVGPFAYLVDKVNDSMIIDEDSSCQSQLDTNQVSIQHNFDTLNRRIDATYETDMFRIFGKVATNTTIHNKYTRIFEMLGDWVPNFIIGVEGKVRFFRATKWGTVEKSPNVCANYTRPSEEMVRYRLLNGKLIDIPLKELKEPFPFMTFKCHKEFDDFDVRGIRIDVSLEEVEKYCSEIERPDDVPTLFERACRRALKAGKQLPSLAYYVRPTPYQLGNSENAQRYCTEVSNNSLALKELEARSYKELLVLYLKETLEIQKSQCEEEENDEFLELNERLLKEVDNEAFTEEHAKEMYEQLKELFGNDNFEEKSKGFRTDIRLYPTELEEESIEMTTEIHFDGRPYSVDVELQGRYNLPPEQSLIPLGVSTETQYILCGYNSINDLIEPMYGHFSLSVDVYCDSVTPRNPLEERGVAFSKLKWKERLTAAIHYSGLFYVPRDRDPIAESYAIAFNTALLKDVVRCRMKPNKIYLFHPCPGHSLPRTIISPYFQGIGFHEDRLIPSIFVPPDFRWSDHNLNDARIHIPIRVINWMLAHPTRLRFYNLEEYLHKLEPLCLSLLSQDGLESCQIDYHDRLSINFDLPIKIAISHNYRWQDSEDESIRTSKDNEEESFSMDKSISSRGRPPSGVKEIHHIEGESSCQAELRNSDPVNSFDVPMKDPDGVTLKLWDPRHAVFASSRRPCTAGDWSAFYIMFVQTERQREERFKQLYSAHWEHANKVRTHEITRYHNPKWISSLIDKPKNLDWFIEDVGPLRPEFRLAMDDHGHQRLESSQEDRVRYEASLIRQDDGKPLGHNVPLYLNSEGRPGLIPTHIPSTSRRGALRGGPRNRGRGGRGGRLPYYDGYNNPPSYDDYYRGGYVMQPRY